MPPTETPSMTLLMVASTKHTDTLANLTAKDVSEDENHKSEV